MPTKFTLTPRCLGVLRRCQNYYDGRINASELHLYIAESVTDSGWKDEDTHALAFHLIMMGRKDHL